jgi:hypothetical protein
MSLDQTLHRDFDLERGCESNSVPVTATAQNEPKSFCTRREPSAVRLHNEAMNLAQKYRLCEAELLEALTRVEREKIYLTFEITSLHEYCVEMLGLSRHTANNFIDVMRASLEVPALAEAIYSGRTTISKARKICDWPLAKNGLSF